MKKYIFIDFDGVLNTERHHGALVTAGKKTTDEFGPCFDPESVANLGKIVDETGAVIVICSSWKMEGVDRMKELWKIRKMPGVLAGCTPDYIPGMDILNLDLDNPDSFAQLAGKGNEVKQWLSENAPRNPEFYRYVILDDVPDFLPEQRGHYIQVDPRVGITVEDFVKAINILR